MALAAARPVQCAMGDHSNAFVSLPDLCPPSSMPPEGQQQQQQQENNKTKEEHETQPNVPLRPRNINNQLTSNGKVPDNTHPPSVDANANQGETQSNIINAPAKAVPPFTATVMESDFLEGEVAAREEYEDNSKLDEEEGTQGQRQGPSPNSSFKGKSVRKPLESALKSSIKKSPTTTPTTVKATRTRRRIRGIWGGDDNASQFSQLHDETLQLILKFLSMKELCIVSMVCQRWKQVSKHEDFWKRIDASDFVEAAYDHYDKTANAEAGQNKPNKATSLELADRLGRHSPQSLVIHSIQHRLSADNFLSSLPSLQELTLTSFNALTDTHIHVLLLSSSIRNDQARSKRSCILKKVALENCTQLTNATVQSIGKMCPELEELSLKGCPKIKDLTPLSDLWFLVKKPASLLATSAAGPAKKPAPPPALSSLAMMFAPPPPPAAPKPQPRRATTPPSLQSLFAPPGDSPKRAANVVSFLPRTLSSGSQVNEPGKLKRIDVSHTDVSAESLLAAWKSIPSGNYVGLQQLHVQGSGESWNDKMIQELSSMVDMSKVQSLNLGCSLIPSPLSKLTDRGLTALIPKDSLTLKSLQKLNLSGHTLLTGTGLGEIISATTSNLEELVLDGCKGLSAKSSNAAKDFASCDAFSKAILKCTTRKAKSNSSGGGRGLLRLSLSRCFSNQTQLQNNSNLQMHEETLGNFVLEAIGKKNKKKQGTVGTLQELDLTECWFVTVADIASLQKRCPGLHRINLQGTRAEETS